MGYIGEFDQVVISRVSELPSALHSFMLFITNVGSPVSCVIILVAIMVWAYLHKNKHLLYTGAAMLLAMPLVSLFKELIKRIRPDTPYVKSMILKSYSFPSGHAYSSLLVYGFLAYIVWRYMRTSWKWPLITMLTLLIILVGLSRIYLGAHFPSDVMGGWILGGIVLPLVLKVGQTHE